LFQFRQGVPIEVVPFAYAKVLQNLHHILGSPNATLRMAVKKGSSFPRNPLMGVRSVGSLYPIAGPLVTDNGNFIIDAPFDEETMKDPYTVNDAATPSSDS
jgi:ribose 5-phosphate isomerase A